MPKLDFCFEGWVCGAEIKTATDTEGNTVDVSNMSARSLADALNKGKLFIPLGNFLYNNSDANIEMSRFKASNV